MIFQETKYSLADEVYNERVFLLTVNCAREAAKRGCGVFIEASTAQVYDGDKVRPCSMLKPAMDTQVRKI